jgi:hypothetical protein
MTSPNLDEFARGGRTHRHFMVEEKLPSGLVIVREVCELTVLLKTALDAVEKQAKEVKNARCAAERN